MRIFLLICIAYITSCSVLFSVPHKYDSVLERALPKKPEWKLKGRINQKELLAAQAFGFDTNCIYVQETIYSTKDNNEKLKYKFLRFWGDGHAMYKNPVLDHFPNRADADNFSWTTPGYYTIQGDIISIEVFGYSGMGWGYGKEQFRIINSRLLCGDNCLQHATPFEKHCIGSLTSIPDW